MNIIKSNIPGVLIIEPRVFKDARGYFFESFSQREFNEPTNEARAESSVLELSLARRRKTEGQRCRPSLDIVSTSCRTMKRRLADEVQLYANWGDYFNRLQNPDTQLPRIKKTCPTLYAVLMEQDEDNVFQFRRKNSGTFESGLGVICKVADDGPLFAQIDNHMHQQVSMLVNKHVVIYEELSNNPPYLLGKTDWTTCGIEQANSPHQVSTTAMVT